MSGVCKRQEAGAAAGERAQREEPEGRSECTELGRQVLWRAFVEHRKDCGFFFLFVFGLFVFAH